MKITATESLITQGLEGLGISVPKQAISYTDTFKTLFKDIETNNRVI